MVKIKIKIHSILYNLFYFNYAFDICYYIFFLEEYILQCKQLFYNQFLLFSSFFAEKNISYSYPASSKC